MKMISSAGRRQLLISLALKQQENAKEQKAKTEKSETAEPTASEQNGDDQK